MKKKLIISISAIVFIAMATVFWMESCRKAVGPIDIPSTEEIVKELAEANTPEKAIISINHLLEKTGIGIPKENSDYELYVIDSDHIEDLAIAQAGFVNGDTSICIGTYYNIFSLILDSLQITSNNEWLFECQLKTSLQNLYIQSGTAINNKENPNNALILTIISQNGFIPEEGFLFDSTNFISPVQAFCYNLWIANQYGEYNILKNNSESNVNWCKVGCYSGYIAGTALCSALTGFWTVLICKAAFKAALNICLSGCHDQGGKK